ncbi:TetR family transcriptional regulator [Sphingomonas sp. Leaf357]|nr:TetR family transcriptional regulator [Sphingomonas sp. Leaf357]
MTTRNASTPAIASPFRATRSTAEERQDKRDALLLAAVRMFNERGFHATSLEDVAASLGVTKPVIYHHLGNKDQVLFECVRIGLEELRSAAAHAREMPGSGLDRLRAFLCRYSEIIMGAFGTCVIRTGDELLSPDARRRFRALKREIDDALCDAITEAAADGSAQVPDVRITAFAFAGALNWPARWFDSEKATPPGKMAAALVEALIAGIERTARPRN